jgi:hypothetical protein
MPAEGGFHPSDSATIGCMFGLPHEKLRETEAKVQSLQGWVTVAARQTQRKNLPLQGGGLGVGFLAPAPPRITELSILIWPQMPVCPATPAHLKGGASIYISVRVACTSDEPASFFAPSSHTGLGVGLLAPAPPRIPALSILIWPQMPVCPATPASPGIPALSILIWPQMPVCPATPASPWIAALSILIWPQMPVCPAVPAHLKGGASIYISVRLALTPPVINPPLFSPPPPTRGWEWGC